MALSARAALARHGDGSFSIEDIHVDAPLGAELLIEVKAVGLCQSDAHLAGMDLGLPAPLLHMRKCCLVNTRRVLLIHIGWWRQTNKNAHMLVWI